MIDLNELLEVSGPPEVSTGTPNWHGHIPFARWLILKTRPRTFVELGVFMGDSYLAFCEAVARFGSGTRCLGVDTWEGDAQAGAIPSEIFAELSEFHDPRYGSFSRLARMLFLDALAEVEDATVDVLHIDGLHTYEAVRNDFETWLPKMSGRGVVLFHDSAVKQGDFGVWKFWAEVSPSYPSFAFQHSYGLGVLAVGPEAPEAVLALCRAGEEAHMPFEAAGASCAALAALRPLDAGRYWPDPDYLDPVKLNDRILGADSPWAQLQAVRHELASVYASNSWKLSAPLRRLLRKR